MYPDGGRKLARTGMRNKLFSLHGLSNSYFTVKLDYMTWKYILYYYISASFIRTVAHTQCRIAARAECAIAQGPDLLGGPVGPPTSAYLHESMALKPE